MTEPPVKPLGLPTTSRGSKRRDALLQAAETLFLQHGYEGVSLDLLIEHAGGSKASIYQYFGNKDGLVRALIETRANRIIDSLTLPPVPDYDSLHQALLTALQYTHELLSHPDQLAFFRLLITATHQNPTLGHWVHQTGPARAQERLAHLLADAHEQGFLDCPYPLESASLFMGLISQARWRTLFGLSPLPADFEAQTYFQYVVERFLRAHQLPLLATR